MSINTVTQIYGLLNPTTGDIFYIGRTEMSLSMRLAAHRRDGKRRNTPKARYIRQLLQKGLQPQIIKLASINNATLKQAQIKEQAYIDFYGLTCRLTNSGDSRHGGTGANARIVWSPELISRLGSVSDATLAKELNCATKTVCYMRNKLGIKPGFAPIKVNWTESLISKLGVIPDKELATLIGCDRSVVADMRIKLGIPKRGRLKTLLPPAAIAKLGTVPDQVIANEFQVSKNIIKSRRRELKIRAFNYAC